MNSYFLGDYYVSDGVKPREFNLRMPIEWIPLEETEDGRTLLLSKDVLDFEGYHYAYDEIVTWETSFLKTCMEDYYAEFFSEEEKAAVLPCEYGHLFILSKEEIERYLPADEQRRAIMYFLDIKKAEIELSIEHYFYWLRGENCSREETPYVTSLGEIDYNHACADETGVRFAMWVDTEKARILSGRKGYDCMQHFWKEEDF